MKWSRAEDEIVRRMWSLGRSAADIAERLPERTRDAVIGRAHRLKLPEHRNAYNRRNAIGADVRDRWARQ